MYRSMALITALIMCQSAFAAPRTDYLSLKLMKMPYQRDYFYPEKTDWDYHLDLTWDVGWGRWFAENDIVGKTFNSRFRDVSWHFTHGFKIVDGLDLVHEHRSQHALDAEREEFPVADSYGIRIIFFERKSK
jgi:hypothetical protein